jgi:hypothetical protein
VTATAPGAVPFGKGGTVSTFDDSLALGRLQAANRIRQGFIDERDARAQQRRLQDLAFNTPATIDNIAAIKGAQKQLLGETEAQGTTAAARAKAQAGQQLTAKERADIGFKERQENRADKEFGLKALAERRKGGQQFANQRRENERRIDQRTQSTVGRLAGSVEEGVEGREVNQARIDRVNALLASSAGKGLVAGEGFDDRDLSIITNLPDLTAVFADALKREGGIDFGPFQAADTLGTQANIRDVLNSIGGFERDTVLGGTVLSEFLGEGRNINLNVAGGGTEDIDFEAFINKSSGTTADQRARALQAFQILTTRGHPTAEALINKVLSPEEAEEYWNRVTTNAPGRVVRGGSPERLGG